MMKTLPRLLVAMMMALGSLTAEVVQPASNIPWVAPSGKTESLAAFKGQPVVILVAPSPRTRAFRAQLRNLRGVAERLGAQKTIFMAAFTVEPGPVPSNIPFVVAKDGAAAGQHLDAGRRFAIAIVGRDGNLDYITHKILPGQRILDVIANSFVTQTLMRRR